LRAIRELAATAQALRQSVRAVVVEVDCFRMARTSQAMALVAVKPPQTVAPVESRALQAAAPTAVSAAVVVPVHLVEAAEVDTTAVAPDVPFRGRAQGAAAVPSAPLFRRQARAVCGPGMVK